MIRFLIYSNIYVSLAAALLTWGTFSMLGVFENHLAFVLLVFFATLFDYNLHRYLKMRLAIGNGEKNEWARTHHTLLQLLLVTGLASTVICFLFLPGKIYGYLAVAAFFTLLYSLPYQKLNISRLDIRKVPLAKPFMIALAWSIVTEMIPQVYAGGNWQSAFSIDFVERFIFILALAIPFDIKDMYEDKKENLRTLPVLIGPKASWFTSNLVIILFIVLSTIYFHPPLALLFVGIGVISLIILNSKKLRQSILYHQLWVDGLILVHGLLLMGTFWM